MLDSLRSLLAVLGAALCCAALGPARQEPGSQEPGSQEPALQGPVSQGPVSQGPGSQGPHEGLALVGGRVHTLVPGAEPARMTILCGAGRIQAIASELEIPEGFEVVDVAGLDLVPGLVDGLAYHDPQHDALYTVHGVTLVCDHGNALGLSLAQSEMAVRDARRGPELRIAGAALDGHPPSTSAALVLESPEPAAFQAKALIDAGVHFLSCQAALASDVRQRLVQVADENRVQIWSVAPPGVGVRELAREGIDGVLFLDGFLPAEQSWVAVEAEQLGALAREIAELRVRVTPVLTAVVRYLDDEGPESPWFEVLDPIYENLWRADWAQRRPKQTAEFVAAGQAAIAKQREFVRALHASGVALVPGSGAPHAWLPPGASLHRELEEWRCAGLTRAEVLAAATRDAARALGLGAQRGTLEVGKVADILCVEGDPLADLGVLRRPRKVVLRGALLEEAELAGMYATLVNESALARERAAEPLPVQVPRHPEGQLVSSGYAEVQSAAGRLSAERWAIVRTDSGRLVFASRGITSEGTEVELSQTVSGRSLESFEFALRTRERVFEVEGELVSERLRIKRSAQGVPIDTLTAPSEIAAIDIGSVASYMLLAHTQPPGEFDVLRFHEGPELELARWLLAVDEEGRRLFRTPLGARAARFDAQGALSELVQRQGNTITRVVVSDVQAPSALELAGAPAEGAQEGAER